MRKYLFLLLVPLVAACKKDSAGCFMKAGEVVSDVRIDIFRGKSVDTFLAVTVGQRIEVELIYKRTPYLEVIAPEKFLPFIKTEIDNLGMLKISENIGCGWNGNFDKKVVVRVGYRNLESIVLNDAAYIANSKDNRGFRYGVYKLTMNSTAASVLEVNCDFLQIDHNSVGPLTIRGNAAIFVPTIYDAGKLDARDFTGDYTFLYHYGNNEAHVRPLKELWVELHNAGNAFYYAEPTDKPAQLKKIGGGNLFRVE